jgi:RND family efflux transporter MFP subunit
MNLHRLSRYWFLIPVLSLPAAGCDSHAEAAKAEMPTPMVSVATPTPRTVTHYERFTGRAVPPEQVEIRAKVSGYLKKISFQPGTEVKKGDPLFEIDPEPFQDEVAFVEAAMARDKALINRLTLEVNRDAKLVPSGAVSQEDYDKVIGSKLEAEATLKGDQAKLASSNLNLGYTKIAAPIDGRIGDKLVTEGNLIAANLTLLTTLVAVERVHVLFDMDENTLERIRRQVREGKLKLAKAGEIPCEVGLAIHGADYPVKGFIFFVDNKVDPKTGTIHTKAEFKNPLDSGFRLFSAGMFARVRVPLGDPVASLLVPEKAFGSDQGTPFLYSVGQDNKATRLKAVVGSLEGDMRVVLSVQAAGDKEPRPLRSDERIVVTGLQRVRPGMAVDPKPAARTPN